MARRRDFPLSLTGLLSGACLALGCSKVSDPNRSSPNPRAAATSPSASVAALPLARPPITSRPGCRALQVTGRVTANGALVESNSVLDGEHWVELEAYASVSLRHTQTTREFKLLGPAKVLPCRAGTEQLLLATGRLSTSANLGVRPGAEVLIATPQGTVRYGDAALDVELGMKGLRVRVKQGEAWVEPEARANPHFENPVRSGSEAHLTPQASSATELVAACEGAARTAAQRAASVLAPEAGADAGLSSLGERAAAHMRERGKARVACAVAAAAIGAEPEATARQALLTSVEHADELWQRVPLPIPGQKN